MRTAGVSEEKRRHVVGPVADLPPGSHRVVEVAGREIGVFNIGGRIYGLPNRCPHQAGPVCTARVLTGTLRADEGTDWRPQWVHDGEVIACPWHGLEFHVPTGRSLAYPRIRLRPYDVTVEDGEIVVWTRR
jgi:nitrite reductase (NADH) small subunit